MLTCSRSRQIGPLVKQRQRTGWRVSRARSFKINLAELALTSVSRRLKPRNCFSRCVQLLSAICSPDPFFNLSLHFSLWDALRHHCCVLLFASVRTMGLTWPSEMLVWLVAVYCGIVSAVTDPAGVRRIPVRFSLCMLFLSLVTDDGTQLRQHSLASVRRIAPFYPQKASRAWRADLRALAISGL